ncbi:hypothetical protein JCM33374_g6245 [Metschnikowia sp. JCM 33374]|nr:hypothetical protein JCM33374_g6245 [Metschnikowia sp. JCM 33374]
MLRSSPAPPHTKTSLHTDRAEMTRLISKWASDESLVSAALEHDKSPKKPEEKPSLARPVKTKLASKWADAPDPQPAAQPPNNHHHHATTTHHKSNSQLPSPPSSAGKKPTNGRHERAGRRKSEGKSGHPEPSPIRGPAHSSGSGGHPGGHSGGQRRPSGSDSGHVLANRLGSLDVSGDHKEPSSKPNNTHTGRGSRAPRHSAKHTNPRASFSDNESDEEPPAGHMSDAAKSFALRIGVPTKDSGSPRKQAHGSHKESASPRKQTPGTRSEKHGFSYASAATSTTKQENSTSTSSKYMTPKQKRALEEQERQAKLAQEQAVKDAKIKAEVQSMFEKMSDKTTNWADFEDDE